MPKPLVIICLLFYCTNAIAQDNVDELDFLKYAYQVEDAGKHDSAIFYFEKAAHDFKQIEKWEKYIECLAGENRNYLRTDRIGDVKTSANEAIKIVDEQKVNKINKYFIEILTQFSRYYWYAKGNYPEALKHLDRAMELCNRADFDVQKLSIQIFTDYGYTYGYAGDFNKSEIYFSKALEQSKLVYGDDNPVVADRYTDLVFPMIQKSEWEKAEIALKKAIELNIKNRGSEDLSVLKNYNNLGYIYLEKYDNDQAILYINKALKMIRDKFGENHRSVGVAYMNLGASYSNKGDTESSIFYSKKALENLKLTVGEKNPYFGIVLNNLGHEYTIAENADSAEFYFKKGLKLRQELYGQDHMEVMRSYGYMSNFYLENEQPAKAIEAIKNAMEIGKKVLPNKHKSVSENYMFLAMYHEKTGDLPLCLEAIQNALIALVPSFDNRNVNVNPKLEDVSSNRIMVEILMLKTNVLNQLFLQKGEIEILKLAAQTAKLTDDAIDILRRAYQTPDSKALLLTRTKDFYEIGISIVFTLHDKTGAITYLKQAFDYFEKSKSILLLENTNKESSMAYAFLPDTLQNKEKSLSRMIETYKEKLYEAKNIQDTAMLAETEDHFFRAKRDYDFLISDLKENYPDFYKLRHDVSTTTLANLQQHINKDQVIVEYFYGQENIYALAIRKSTIKKLEVPLSLKLNQEIRDYIKSFEAHQFDKKLSNTIYNQILKPFFDHENEAYTAELTFVPDGSLHYLPFETLVTSMSSSGSSKYMIQDFTINYLHSAGISKSPAHHKKPGLNYLGFSPSYSGQSATLLASRSGSDRQMANELEKLPMAEKEILTSAKLWNGHTFIKEFATEANFKRNAKNAGIIHIASHTIIDDENPMNSKLVFSAEADTIEDGMLHTYELYNMKLDAQLACLSACNTGMGKISGGEGVVSLAKGFFYAGVPNVLMSLWSVPDQSTSEIMIDFYEELKNGLGKADALRNAKLRYLKSADANTSDPYYWAAFTIIGDNEPIMQDEDFNYWYLALFTGILMVSVFFIKLKK